MQLALQLPQDLYSGLGRRGRGDREEQCKRERHTETDRLRNRVMRDRRRGRIGKEDQRKTDTGQGSWEQ